MSNIYMIIAGINGNVSAQGHQNTIALHSVHFEASRTIGTAIGKGPNREPSIPYFSEVTITKSLDSASNALFQHLCKAQNIPQVEIHVCSTDDALEPYVKYTLKNVMIAQHSHGAVGGNKPTERLKLNYTEMQIVVHPRDASNKLQPPTLAGYNLATAQVS